MDWWCVDGGPDVGCLGGSIKPMPFKPNPSQVQGKLHRMAETRQYTHRGLQHAPQEAPGGLAVVLGHHRQRVPAAVAQRLVELGGALVLPRLYCIARRLIDCGVKCKCKCKYLR